MARLVRRVIPSAAAVALIAVIVSRLGTGPFLRADTRSTPGSLQPRSPSEQ